MMMMTEELIIIILVGVSWMTTSAPPMHRQGITSWSVGDAGIYTTNNSGYAVTTVWAEETCSSYGSINYQEGYLTNACITEYGGGIAVSSISIACNSTSFAISQYSSTTCDPSTYVGQQKTTTSQCISTLNTTFASLGAAYSLECIDNPSSYDSIDDLINIEESVLTLSYGNSSDGCRGSILKFAANATSVCFPNSNGSREFNCNFNSPSYNEYKTSSCQASQLTDTLYLETSCSSLNLTSGAITVGCYTQTSCFPLQPSSQPSSQPTSTYGSIWTMTTASSGNWNGIATDKTGQYLIAVNQFVGIYKSSSG